MSEADDAPAMAQPAANPDAQTTVNDFLDYTDFFPSDLARSLTLIGDLDATYREAVQHVHDLTARYGDLPTLPEQERPDPALLRKQIAQHLQTAINQREFAYTEATRLYEVTLRHCQRSSVIKRKLQAQPEPPSRDPTPPPVSPTAHRALNRNYERPAHLRLAFDTARHGANTSRPRHRNRKTAVLLPRGRSRAYSVSSDSSGGDSDTRSAIDVAISPRKHKQHRDRHAKPGRSRPPGVLGTNVHSAVAGISTSNALAQLAPPPPDARPGSKWAPWMKLTEYEMAVLRKQMKKNAVWTPSLTMVNRELERKHRTKEDFERELARCEAAGEEMIDEEPETLQQIMTASGLGQLAPHGPAAEEPPVPVETTKEHPREESSAVSIRLKAATAIDGRKLDRSSQRQQAMRDAQELVDATEKIKEAANGLKELTFGSHTVTTPTSQKRRVATRPSNKRKREASLAPATEGGRDATREESVATQDSSTKAPDPKRARLQLIAPAPNAAASPVPTPVSALSSPRELAASLATSPVVHTPVPLPDAVRPSSNTNLIQVPLAPAGPSTPKVNQAASAELSRQTTPAVASPTEPTDSSSNSAATSARDVVPPPAAPAMNVTAASSRPRRESTVPRAASPPNAPAQPLKTSKTNTPAPEHIPDALTFAPRPRSARGHVPTPKAQSEEPKPKDISRIVRETRRHSIFSQSALTAPGSTRTSSRKKPPPKGEVTAAENGQKTITSVKRAQGSKNRKTRKSDEESEQADEMDPDEARYCSCNDYSYGEMIQCDNHCEQEWFHLDCVKMTAEDLPPRRTDWFCPKCREALGCDAYGRPLVPPPLPGRRGNREWST